MNVIELDKFIKKIIIDNQNKTIKISTNHLHFPQSSLRNKKNVSIIKHTVYERKIKGPIILLNFTNILDIFSKEKHSFIKINVIQIISHPKM